MSVNVPWSRYLHTFKDIYIQDIYIYMLCQPFGLDIAGLDHSNDVNKIATTCA